MKTWRSYDGLMNNERSVKIASPLGGQRNQLPKYGLILLVFCLSSRGCITKPPQGKINLSNRMLDIFLTFDKAFAL